MDLPRAYPLHHITGALNHYLEGQGVIILSAEAVDEEFHARFSATGRQYLYRILNRRSPPTLEKGRVWHVIKPLDLGAMREAAQVLVGAHDFTSFRSIKCQAKNPARTLDLLTLERRDDLQKGLIDVHVQSKAFLHNQVRILVGTLKLVGEGRWTVEDVKHALEAKDRTRGGPTAPPEGLYFKQVFYTPLGHNLSI
jgi:tRNA pseudouridine38-40 synthase